jgi:hypothetical protein
MTLLSDPPFEARGRTFVGAKFGAQKPGFAWPIQTAPALLSFEKQEHSRRRPERRKRLGNRAASPWNRSKPTRKWHARRRASNGQIGKQLASTAPLGGGESRVTGKRRHRHARERGHPGARKAGAGCLDPRFRGGDTWMLRSAHRPGLKLRMLQNRTPKPLISLRH